jgi:hypothetical protein
MTSQITWAMAKRDTALIEQVLNSSTKGVWNKTFLKDHQHCQDFRGSDVPSFFFHWPEGTFQYCCQGIAPQSDNMSRYNFSSSLTGERSLSDYRYSQFGNPILSAAYYDLGLIDDYLPYYTWRCLHMYRRYMDTPLFASRCEWNDMIRFYKGRFWRVIFGKYGLAETALPLVALLQLAVFMAIGLEVVHWRYWHSRAMDKTGMSVAKLNLVSMRWFHISWKNAWTDWLHLCLLSVIGNGLVEAVGRTNAFAWQAKMFHRYSTLYLALTVVLWISSFFHQVTQWIAVDKKVTKNLKKTLTTNQQRVSSLDLGGRDSGEVAELQKLDKYRSPVAELKGLLKLGPDWKWQPIAAQAAILFCLWAYLTYPNEDDNFTSTLLGFLVQAASPWSGLYAGRVLFVTLPFLLKKLFGVKHVRQLLRSRKPKPGSNNLLAMKQPNLAEWWHWGRKLCCLGCCVKEDDIEKNDPEKNDPHVEKNPVENGPVENDPHTLENDPVKAIDVVHVSIRSL